VVRWKPSTALLSVSLGVRFEVVGALDESYADDIPEPAPDGYPLETRLRDGTRVMIDAGFGAVSNLEGGMVAWARDVEPGLPVW